MSEIGQGLQIVSVNKFHQFNLEERELEQLLLREDIKDLPVVVVSVAGAYRGGKSFLLNFFLRYLSAPDSSQKDGSWLGEDSAPLAGFKWRSGIKATTLGILMWSEPFIRTLPSGEKVAVLLVDTQGTFDNKSTFRDNSTIFALSTLVSSVQIYNLSHDIKEDDLQHLELFTEYGKLVNVGNTSSKAFQVLEFLVRDWQFPDETYPFGAVGGENLLKDKLDDTGLTKDMQTLRYHIRSSFDKVSCFLMPHPGFKVLAKTFKGNISDIDPEFRTNLKDLVNSLFNPAKLLPKTINGEKIKAQDLFSYFKAYMDLFNSDELPTPENIMAMTVKAGLLSAVREAREVYEKGMDAECGPKQLSVPPVDLKYLHKKYSELAINHFKNKKKLGSEKEATEYLEKLTKEIEERLPQFLQSNLSKIQTAINVAKESYDASIQNVHRESPLCVHPIDLAGIHQTALNTAIKMFDAARKRITQQQDEEKEKFIRSFDKKFDLLRRTNEQNNKTMTTELKMAYWQQMQSKSTVDPPLSSVEFRKVHQEALNKALVDFDSKRNRPNNYTEDVHKFNLTKGIQESFAQMKDLNKSKNKLAMHAGIEAYDNYIKEQWDQSSQCLHPEDLEEIHRMGTCRALEGLHPRKQCAAGFDTDDEDETLLKEILDKRHEDLKQINIEANESAILTAYNEYTAVMDDKTRFSIWWIFIIPYIMNKNQRESFHGEAKQTAINVFNGKRKSSEQYADDPYRRRLDEMIQEAYENTYK